MKRLPADVFLVFGLLAVLTALTVFGTLGRPAQGPQPALASDSSARDGAHALWLWLQALGLDVSDEVSFVFAIPPGTGQVLLLEPLTPISRSEWEQIDEWVEGGGTLLLAGRDVAAQMAVSHYGFDLSLAGVELPPPELQAPLMASPPLTAPPDLRTVGYFDSHRRDFVTHLAADGKPVLVSFVQGEGLVVLSATSFPFSNGGLREEGNPELVLNLVQSSLREGSIWFDEWHHGKRSSEEGLAGPGDWLRSTPFGRSLLYAAGAAFLAVVLHGRPFGRPISARKSSERRGPLEYVLAMANLSRRAGHRGATLRHYYRRLKRALGLRYRLNVALPDAEFVGQLRRMRPEVDAGGLLRLLAGFQAPDVAEADLVRMAAEASDWMEVA